MAGVSPATVARIEKGRMEPTLDLMTRLASAAGLDLVVEIREPDADERKERIAARSLSHEERLEQNDNLSRLAVSVARSRR